ncbi:MAG: ImmA/IrrE family metallo-endopeptidase [Solirubrobacteraceae bacterium]
MTSSSVWTERLVLRLIERHKGKAPTEIIEAEADRLLKESEQNELPIDVDLIASCLGIRRRIASFGFAGRIYAEESGQLVMDLNADDSEPRRRFTASHEIIHTVFPGFKREARYRTDASAEANPRNREEEYLCDLGAAALLMPRAMVAKRLTGADGLGAIQALAADAQVSLEAAGNRIVSLSETPVVFLVLSMAHKPADGPALRRGEDVPEQLRVRYATTAHLNTYVPRYKAAHDASSLCRAFEGRAIQHGLEPLPGAEPDGVFSVEAKGYGNGPNRRVLALTRPAA